MTGARRFKDEEKGLNGTLYKTVDIGGIARLGCSVRLFYLR
jgi:hypothetical protein